METKNQTTIAMVQVKTNNVVLIMLGTLAIILVGFTAYILTGGSLTGIGKQKACTMEAKICPDGSSVGRTGQNCEFAPCPTVTSMTIRTLYTGNAKYADVNSQEMYSIINDAEYNILMMRLGGSTGTKVVLPVVDFSKEMVLVALSGTKSTNGYGIEIKSVVISGDKLKVEVEESEPGKNCMVGQQITYPKHIVAIPTGSYVPEFNVTKKTISCSTW